MAEIKNYVCPCSSKGFVYQSPIVLQDGEDIFYSNKKLTPINGVVKDYKFYEDTKEFHVGSTVEFTTNANKLTLKEFHFHDLGEHVINKQKGALEIHFVFVSKTGHITPVGYLIQCIGSEKHSDCTEHIKHKHGGTSKAIKSIIKGEPFKITPPCPFWSYAGSLTGPPFDVNVNWIMADKILRVTEKDLELIRSFSKGHREIQSRAGRNIIHSG